MNRTLAPLALLAALLATDAAWAQPQSKAADGAPPGPQCLRSSNWQGWKASPDGRSMYLGGGINQTWRFDFVRPCPELNRPLARIVNRTRAAWICRPIDVDMRVVVPPELVTVCLVNRITRLTPQQAQALPRELRP